MYTIHIPDKNYSWCSLMMCNGSIIGRAGASPPSRATGAIFIYLTDCVHTYRIVLNVYPRFYFRVYATISLEPSASLLYLNQAPCLLTPCTHLGRRQLRQYQVYNRPFLVLERNQLLLRFTSTNNQAVRLRR